MIDVRFVPIERWPKTPTLVSNQRDAAFRASYSNTLDLLEQELRKLSAHNITIQAYFNRADIRNDGWPKSSAKPTAAGVVLSFDVRKWDAVQRKNSITELSFPCDTFTTFDDNLRAIALALEALRKVDRYGVAPANEQYKGWAQLSEPPDPSSMNRDEAVAFIAGHSAFSASAVLNGQADRAYKVALMKLHPDNPVTGNHELFLRLQRAKEVLGL
jgi:hypothetical protein